MIRAVLTYGIEAVLYSLAIWGIVEAVCRMSDAYRIAQREEEDDQRQQDWFTTFGSKDWP